MSVWMESQSKKATLILQDGTQFHGVSIGKQGSVIGEVVFTTSMVGYQEALTDPSNYGYILTQTFPLIGNYGTNSFSNESDKVHLKGYIVRELCEEPSNFQSEKSLGEFLNENNVVGISGIDTRKLTKHIRQNGVMNGFITTDEITDIGAIIDELLAFKACKVLMNSVSTADLKIHKPENSKYNVAMLDLGVKKSLIDSFLERDCTVYLFPFDSSSSEIIKANPDAIVITDGAFDPNDNECVLKTVSELFESGIPMLGIGLGHQIIALSKGGKIKKMHCGHRGANQPVFCKKNSRTYITAQNHGYIVEQINGAICEVTYHNANDKTCEGLRYKDMPVISVQFTPDSIKTMVSTSFVYDEFFELMIRGGK